MAGLARRDLGLRLARLPWRQIVRYAHHGKARRSLLSCYRYQRAYVDFFEDQLVLHGYDWIRVMNKYLFEGREPLINCLISNCTYAQLSLRSPLLTNP